MFLIINTNKLLMNKNLIPYIYMNFCHEKKSLRCLYMLF